ncbi:hypothetical protein PAPPERLAPAPP_01000 [Brevundimonas phage vB_BpoS-Papperlapapp]|uniref:Uncharacterized protein n=1 Tax=Brevundimonas phage vB_BpoS-Domovoi TaxID=2948598 RepID=A0A9E7MRG9_9CAUD|nr:hypothetical protein DOMOVOI_05780 [Brevundimonas phage vB_BpoS-Domovoi]USN15842.1 hypothetical protein PAPPERLAPAPP_01000 [Brevundimonas phage vB_BpoS-Papperlapapp]
MASFFKTARFAHDCAACRLVAAVAPNDGRDFDLYLCDAEGSLIARTGDDGADYTSMPLAFADHFAGETESDMGRAFFTYRLFRERRLIRQVA